MLIRQPEEQSGGDKDTQLSDTLRVNCQSKKLAIRDVRGVSES